MPALFHTAERSDRTPQGHSEDSFAFLDRIDSPYWAQVRTQLDEWYTAFPDADGDLLKRFRSRDPRQHYPAWWELYIYTLLRKLGYSVTIHPEISDSTGRPDFLAERGDESFYVEAAAVFSGIIAPGRRGQIEAKIKDILESIPAHEVMVKFDFTRIGDTTPRRRAITQPIEEWLSTIDADDLLARSALGACREFAFGDWAVELTPIPRSREFRGCPDNTLLGTGGAIAGFTDDAAKLRAAIRRKGKHYGTPDRPLVVAVLAANGFVGEDEIVGALFGAVQVRVNIQTGEQSYTRSRDGVWVGKSGPAAKRISAVMLGISVLPNGCATRPVRVWHHYEPTHPFTAELPLPTARVGADGSIDYTEGSASPAEILALAPDWPGPGPSFIRCEHLPGDHGAYG
jgi:hypothetical protein